ncbi:hypothetical protein [Lacrimispora celerecrescens]|uniref:Uncharacterized protein n=1 Tax=[Clostridium] celerecrescens 18A TaxID=1286362 RepID=A0A2M8Z301_9FIRM|nr:hypothetical protein [Lacrimispora celerecrescens]PJJ27836.1 hypothetical protein H171_1316 [[Clostridium] celerecrescens 18A]
MRILTIGGKDYNVEFSFEAAEYKDCVDSIFKVISGSYIMKNGPTDENEKISVATAILNGTSDMVSDIPKIAVTALYAGLLENNPVENEQAAKALFKQFVKEKPDDERASFWGMYDFLRDCMEEDGFFKLTGMDKVIAQMSEAAEEQKSKSGKIPQDHKRKSTSTK